MKSLAFSELAGSWAGHGISGQGGVSQDDPSTVPAHSNVEAFVSKTKAFLDFFASSSGHFLISSVWP